MLEANAKPRFEKYFGDDRLAFVISLNLSRRHLDQSQRSMVAARLATMGKAPERTFRQLAKCLSKRLANMLNVGKRSVERARTVLNEGAPELTVLGRALTLTIPTAPGRERLDRARFVGWAKFLPSPRNVSRQHVMQEYIAIQVAGIFLDTLDANELTTGSQHVNVEHGTALCQAV
jgi:hypothetical protein